MRVLWSRIKQAGAWAYLLIPVALLGVIWLVRKVLAPKPKAGLPPPSLADDGLARTLGEVSDRLAEANNKAAVEIAVARTQENEHRISLATITANPDAKQRRRDLIALRQRMGN